MEFLPALQNTGIFTRGRKDRPFGMPDIDSGGLGAMLRELGPLASSMKDDDVRRQKDLMQFEHSLKNQQRNPNKMQEQLRRNMGPQVINQSRGGFSPMQQMLQQREDVENKQEFVGRENELDRNAKLAQAMEEIKSRGAGEMERLAAEINARKEISAADRGSREKISETEARIRAGETAAERAVRISEGAANRANQREIAGMPARSSLVTPPTQQDDVFKNRLQQLSIDNPAAAALLTKDPNTGAITFKPGATEGQKAWVQNYLKQAGPTQPGQRGAGKGTITQRNKKTGETRVVPVK